MFETCLSENPEIRSKDIQYLENNFHSPFTVAAAENKFEKVEELLITLTEEELNWQGIFGNTALHWAVANTNSRMALKLLENTPRIKVDILDKHKKTVLHLAVAKGWNHFTDVRCDDNELPQSSIIKELAKKADLNIQDANGNTPLHIAVMRRDVECIKLLLNSGAREDIRNHQGQTPCDMLRIEFQQVKDFIYKYASVFTLLRSQWNKNQNTVLESFKDKIDCNVFLDKEKHVREEEKENPTEDFNQAICDLEDWLIHNVNNNPANLAIRQSVKHFLLEVKNLQVKVVDLLLHEEITFDDGRKLASESLKLSQKIANSTIVEADVIAFRKATATYRKTPTLNKILGAIIGAALGICIGLLAGPITGLLGGVQGAILGASLGSVLGILGFWGTKRYQEQQHPLQQLESAATKHIQWFPLRFEIPIIALDI